MGFLSPWFLAGAAALSVPIYLHLLRHQTATPRPFSSLMFFERRTQSSVRQRRLRYLLLLSLRLALLFLLVLAFTDPYLNRPAASMAGNKLLVLAVDDSFSMRAGTRLADARREALSVLDSRAASERAQVVSLGSQFHVLTQPTLEPGELRAAIGSIKLGDSRGNFGELARALRVMADSVHTPIEVHLFSDLQKSAMPPNFSEVALPANVSLILHPVVKSTEPNWAVESVNAPGDVADPKKARVEAIIAGYNTPAAKRTVSLSVNGKIIATRSVDVPAGGRATATFDSLDVPYGFSRCQVSIDPADTMPADNVSLFAVERSDPRRVLFVHEASDRRSPLYFAAALGSAAESAFALEVVATERAASFEPSKYSFVVLSDVLSVPSAFENDLLKYVNRGGSVLIAVGTSGGRRARVPVFGGNILEPRNYSRDGEGFLTVGETDPSHPALEKAAQWAGVKFYYAVSVDTANARVVARLTDHTPILLDKKIGEGRVLLLASGLDNLTNDFPLHPVFVPFVEQTSRYLSGTQRRSGSRLVDSSLELRTAKEKAVSVEVIDPDGDQPLSLAEATSAQSYQLTRTGFYQLRLANGREDLIGVNADRRESDLEVIPDDVLALWRGNGGTEQHASSEGAVQEQAKQPYRLWWYVIMLALAMAVAESLLSSQYLGTQREGS